MKIRKAGVKDIEPLVELMQLTDSQLSPKARDRAERYISNKPKDRLILVYEDIGLLGYVGMKKEDDDKDVMDHVDTFDISSFACLTWIGVEAQHQRLGIGTQLIQACDDIATKWSKTGIWLTCREKYLPFYISNRYFIKGYYKDDGKMRYVMGKGLKK